MGNYSEPFGSPSTQPGGQLSARGAAHMQMASGMPTLRDRLDRAVADAQARLKVVEEARAIFDRNPDMERLLELMQEGHF